MTDSMMVYVVASYCVVAIVVASVSRALMYISKRVGLDDVPDDRKIHAIATPQVGGIAMFIGFAVGAILFIGENLFISDGLDLMVISCVAMVIGVIDDISDVTVTARLFFQILIALIITSFLEERIDSLGDIIGIGGIELGGLSILITVFAIVGGINSFNVMDGLDGLAGGIAVVLFSSVIYLSYINDRYDVLFTSILFITILGVFLYYNIYSINKIFMGDAGSMFIGAWIVWYLITFSQGENQLFRPVTALWIYAIPLIDILTVILLRIKKGGSPFLPDNQHIHHWIMYKYCFDGRKAGAVIVIGSIIIAMIGVSGEQYNISETIMFVGFMTLFVSYFVARFHDTIAKAG